MVKQRNTKVSGLAKRVPHRPLLRRIEQETYEASSIQSNQISIHLPPSRYMCSWRPIALGPGS